MAKIIFSRTQKVQIELKRKPTDDELYDVRGLDADVDLTDYEFIELNRA